jgi:glutathione synthase/RimK-type ligase-like ATP-grasp enzyme
VVKTTHVIINWGCSKAPDRLAAGKFINKPAQVAAAGNKLTTFDLLKGVDGVSIPEYTTDYQTACKWVEEEGKVVVCRTKLQGHSGAGIVLAARVEDVVVNCPLYVKYIKKASEYRVHVAFGEVIDVQAKRQRTDYEGTIDFAIRNHHTGWVYCRENIVEPADLRANALTAIRILGLDFGAVDIIYNKHLNKSYVLEVNCAPGLEGTSVTNYTEAFTKYFGA